MKINPAITVQAWRLALALARKRAEENLAAALAEIKRLKQVRPREPYVQILALPAEAHIALGIARGETLAFVAAIRGVFIATARTQLKSVFSKLGAHRQSQLVALLSRRLS